MRLAALLLASCALALAQPSRPVDEIATNQNLGPIRITPVRHGTLLLEGGGIVIAVDPWSQANYEGLPKADVILITDIHSDHMDPKGIAMIRKEGTQIYAPEAVAKTIPDAIVIRNGESRTLAASQPGKLWHVQAVPMYNLKRGPSEGKLFHDKGRGNGYVLSYANKRIYMAGDTEGTPEMRALKYIDVAFLPMNLPYTMPPEEAAEAVRAFMPKIVYPYHYREANTQAFAKALEGTNIDVRLRNWYY